MGGRLRAFGFPESRLQPFLGFSFSRQFTVVTNGALKGKELRYAYYYDQVTSRSRNSVTDTDGTFGFELGVGLAVTRGWRLWISFGPEYREYGKVATPYHGKDELFETLEGNGATWRLGSTWIFGKGN